MSKSSNKSSVQFRLVVFNGDAWVLEYRHTNKEDWRGADEVMARELLSRQRLIARLRLRYYKDNPGAERNCDPQMRVPGRKYPHYIWKIVCPDWRDNSRPGHWSAHCIEQTLRGGWIVSSYPYGADLDLRWVHLRRW